MFSHISVSNTINKLFNNNNILYLGQKNLFYNTLKENTEYNIITNTQQPFVGIAHDDPLLFSQQSNILQLQYHCNALVFFHNDAPKVLKKEDKYILSTKLKNVIKVFFSNAIQESWGLSQDANSYSIQYGCNIGEIENIATKDIAILNINNNDMIKQIYAHIRTNFPNSDLITSISNSKQICEYRVVLCLENIYDALCCAAHGCEVLCNQNIQNLLPSIHKIKDINNINEQISQILLKPKDDISLTHRFISDHFELNQYYRSINHIFSLLKNRAYVYEA